MFQESSKNKGFIVCCACVHVSARRESWRDSDSVHPRAQLSVNQEKHIKNRCCLLNQACSQWTWFISTFVAATLCLDSRHQRHWAELTLT